MTRASDLMHDIPALIFGINICQFQSLAENNALESVTLIWNSVDILTADVITDICLILIAIPLYNFFHTYGFKFLINCVLKFLATNTYLVTWLMAITDDLADDIKKHVNAPGLDRVLVTQWMWLQS